MTTSRTGTAKYLRNSRRVKRQARTDGLTHCPGTERGPCPYRHQLDYDTPKLPNSAESDHVAEHQHGGTDDTDNLRVICRACNLDRNKRPPVTVAAPDDFPTSRAW